jgi:hypothetical protein
LFRSASGQSFGCLAFASPIEPLAQRTPRQISGLTVGQNTGLNEVRKEVVSDFGVQHPDRKETAVHNIGGG